MTKKYAGRFLFQTNRLGFKFVERSNIGKGWLSWMKDIDNLRHLAPSNRGTDESRLLEYLDSSKPPKVFFFAAYLLLEQKYVGNIRLSGIGEEKSGCYGRLLGDPNAKGMGLGKEMLAAIQGAAFEYIGLDSIWTEIYSKNIASRKSNLSGGMRLYKKETRKTDTGEPEEFSFFSLTKDEYKTNNLDRHGFVLRAESLVETVHI